MFDIRPVKALNRAVTIKNSNADTMDPKLKKMYSFALPEKMGAMRVIEVSDGDVSSDSFFERE